jgi:AcrR family transcriptional regulator
MSELGIPGEPPTNRRERKKQETRAALEQAALRLFAEKGYQQTTVDEIAEAADVAVRTFFRYFSSKQHILFGDVAHQRIAHLRAALAASPPDEPPLATVRGVLDALDLDPDEQEQIILRLRLMERQPSLVSEYLLLNHELREVLTDFVAARTGLAPTDSYPLLVASAAVTSWDVALRAWSAGNAGDSLADLRRRAFAALTAGIPAPPGTAQPASRRVAR